MFYKIGLIIYTNSVRCFDAKLKLLKEIPEKSVPALKLDLKTKGLLNFSPDKSFYKTLN